MPPTIEELQAELAKNKGTIDHLTNELNQANEKINHAMDAIKEKDGTIAGYKKAERDALEAQLHSINSKLDCKDMSDSDIKKYMAGWQDSAEAIKNSTKSGGGSTKIPEGDPKNKPATDVHIALKV